MGDYFVRLGAEKLKVSRKARDTIKELAESRGMTVSNLLMAIAQGADDGTFHFADECGQRDRINKKFLKQEKDDDLDIEHGLSEFIDEAKRMDKKSAIQMLMKLSNKKKKEVKAMNDSGMFGPDSWAHFLEQATKKAAPPEEVAYEAIRHYRCMILAAVGRGENPDYLRLAMRDLHLSRGMSWSRNGKSPLIRYGQDRPWGSKEKQDNTKVLH